MVPTPSRKVSLILMIILPTIDLRNLMTKLLRMSHLSNLSLVKDLNLIELYFKFNLQTDELRKPSEAAISYNDLMIR
jgi:hypothetical protein